MQKQQTCFTALSRIIFASYSTTQLANHLRCWDITAHHIRLSAAVILQKYLISRHFIAGRSHRRVNTCDASLIAVVDSGDTNVSGAFCIWQNKHQPHSSQIITICAAQMSWPIQYMALAVISILHSSVCIWHPWDFTVSLLNLITVTLRDIHNLSPKLAELPP